MRGIFDGILIASDLDGTMVTSDYRIPKVNLEAVRFFCENGGYFAASTGRSSESCRPFIEKIKPNIPCIVLNGAIIYDFATEKVLWEAEMPHDLLKYVTSIMERFPTVGVEIFGKENNFILSMNKHMQEHLNNGDTKYTFCKGINEVHGRLYKALFIDDSKIIKELCEYVTDIEHEGAEFVTSSDCYFEMLASNINKGEALLKLAQILGIKKENTYAIGDYYNDAQLIRVAGTGVCVASAPQEIKDIADLIVCTCEQGSIARLISHISAKNNPI